MNYAIILSGGTGSRLKGIEIPKQYYIVKGKPIFYYSLKTIAELPIIDHFLVVASHEWTEFISEYLQEYQEKFVGFVEPGQNRQLSIYNGMKMLRDIVEDRDIVLIHDAARPLVSSKTLEECIKGAKYADGAMPVLEMKDTVYMSGDGKRVDLLLEREHIYAGQAPEAFVYGKYLKANQALSSKEILKISGSSEVALRNGMKIDLIQGDERNFKITTCEDLKQFERIMNGG